MGIMQRIEDDYQDDMERIEDDYQYNMEQIELDYQYNMKRQGIDRRTIERLDNTKARRIQGAEDEKAEQTQRAETRKSRRITGQLNIKKSPPATLAMILPSEPLTQEKQPTTTPGEAEKTTSPFPIEEIQQPMPEVTMPPPVHPEEVEPQLEPATQIPPPLQPPMPMEPMTHAKDYTEATSEPTIDPTSDEEDAEEDRASIPTPANPSTTPTNHTTTPDQTNVPPTHHNPNTALENHHSPRETDNTRPVEEVPTQEQQSKLHHTTPSTTEDVTPKNPVDTVPRPAQDVVDLSAMMTILIQIQGDYQKMKDDHERLRKELQVEREERRNEQEIFKTQTGFKHTEEEPTAILQQENPPTKETTKPEVHTNLPNHEAELTTEEITKQAVPVELHNFQRQQEKPPTDATTKPDVHIDLPNLEVESTTKHDDAATPLPTNNHTTEVQGPTEVITMAKISYIWTPPEPNRKLTYEVWTMQRHLDTTNDEHRNLDHNYYTRHWNLGHMPSKQLAAWRTEEWSLQDTPRTGPNSDHYTRHWSLQCQYTKMEAQEAAGEGQHTVKAMPGMTRRSTRTVSYQTTTQRMHSTISMEMDQGGAMEDYHNPTGPQGPEEARYPAGGGD